MTRFPNLRLGNGGPSAVREAIDRVDRNVTTVSIAIDFWQLFKKVRKTMGEAHWRELFGDDVQFEGVNKYVNEAARLMLQLALAERKFCCGMRDDENETKSFEIYVALADNVATLAELQLANTVASPLFIFFPFAVPAAMDF